MTKTKLKVDILAQGSENEALCNAIASHNSGSVLISLSDLISYANMRQAIMPNIRKGFIIYRADEDQSLLFVSYDDGDNVSMTIQEVELEELETPSDIPQGLFQQPGEVGYLGDN